MVAICHCTCKRQPVHAEALNHCNPSLIECVEAVLYYNQIVELPMSLLIIQARLQNYYYRQPAALRHDAQLLASNARNFNGEGGEIAQLAESGHFKYQTFALACIPYARFPKDMLDILGGSCIQILKTGWQMRLLPCIT